MTLEANGGTDVVVADDESVSAGSGMKLRIYNADIATIELPALPALGDTSAPYAPGRPANADDVQSAKDARLRVLRDAARRANAYGNAIVVEFQTNAKARVGAAVAGLQKTPNPNDPGTLTAASGANLDLPIV